METIAGKKENIKKLFSMTSLLIVLLVVAIAANGIVWKDRLGRSAEIAALNTELSQVSHDIARAPAPPTDLEIKLALATAGLTAAQAAVPPEFNRNDAVDYIINLAKECQVEALPISSQGWAADKTDPSYHILKLNTAITGTFTHANDFIDKLQNGRYPALVVPEISITRDSSPDTAGTFSGDDTKVTVRLDISIYARLTAAKGSS